VSHRAFIVAIACALTSAPLHAQRVPVPVGARVRVDWSDSSRGVRTAHRNVLGAILRQSADTMVIAVPSLGDTIAVPRASIIQMDVNRGVSRRGTAIVAGVLGAVMWTGGAYWANHNASGSTRLATALAFGVVGAAGGAYLGARYPAVKWERVVP
jgi:uncharacterized protein YcfJ